MKKALWLFCCLSLSSGILGQTYLNIDAGYVKISGNVDLVLHNTQWDNNGSFSATDGTVHITGEGIQTESSIGGDSTTTFYNLHINKSSNAAQLDQAIQVDNELQMNSGNLDLNGYDLTLGSAGGIIINELPGSRIVGMAGGEVIKVIALNAPAAVNPGNIGVIITSSANLGSTSIKRGHQPQTIYSTEGMERYYEITPTNNNALDATVSFTYYDTELNSNTESNLDAWRAGPVNWTNFVSNSRDATNNEIEVTGIDSFSLWTLRDGSPKLSAKVLLQGPYAGGSMSDALRSNDLLPTTEPYTGLGFAHVGEGGGETVDPAVFDISGADAIVDWVFVELRDENDSTNVLQTKSALLQADGDIVDLDGHSPLFFPNLNSADYFIAVRHRNHLGVMSSNVVNITLASNSYDFTSDMTQAHGTDPMTEVSTGTWAIWGGNANSDTAVRVTGPPSINDYSSLLNYLGGPSNIISNVYAAEDINMDGTARATGPPTINDYSRLLNILGGSTNIIFQQF